MKVISFNANGIRAAARKGFYSWLAQEQADFVCIQETKAQRDQLEAIPDYFPAGYHCDYFDAEKKGYSGVAIYARKPPIAIQKGFGCQYCDTEGRYLQFDYPGLTVICGDYNIAHRNIDLKNWRGNQKNSGFLPEERAWLDHVFDTIGLVDAFRVLNQEPDQYTWWSMRQRAWEKNVGWRIDYQMITPGLVSALQTVSIYREQPFSDHAPLIMTYDVTV